MFSRIIGIGRSFDWFTPTFAFIENIYYGSASKFGIAAGNGWSRNEIRRLLNDYEIDVWGLMYNFDGDLLMFTVRKSEAELTYWLLEETGIPVLYAPVNIYS